MNWILALVGAVVGAGLVGERGLFGAVSGFLLVYLMLSLNRLRGDVDGMARELALIKSRLAALSIANRAETAAPAAPAASRAEPPVATPAAMPGSMPDAQPAAPALVSTPAVSAVAEASASPAVAAATVATPPRIPELPRQPAAPAAPGWEEQWTARVKSWFTEGNVPVKIGVLVLLFGVAAALKLAAERGYFNLQIEVRLALIAGAALAGLGWGWRERERRPAFGLSLQGGALGVLLLTVFATYRLYGLLPPMLAFALVVVLVAGSSLLAVLQKNMALAVLGFLGGYLAPVLISTGSNNPVGLFSYYAVLNAAVFAMSWRQSWRLLNLIGFVFTFGVGAAWGQRYYRPELFASVEPFLVVFFLFYIGIGLMYVIRQTEHRRPWVDGTLVFGTPLVAFPLQAGMLKDDRIGLAFSALAVALVYAALVYWLRRRRGERLLTEAYAALALGFATLAVPLAFSASTTASLWALEGAGVAWLGIRQGRNFPWLAGLALQLLAAGAYCLSLWQPAQDVGTTATLLLNARWLGAALLAFAGFALSLIHDRHRPRLSLPAITFAWACLWWFVGGVGQFDLASASIGEWQFAALYLAVSIALATALRNWLPWTRLDWLLALAAIAGPPLVFAADGDFGSALARPTLAFWALYFAALAWSLWSAGTRASRSLAVVHLAAMWSIVLALTMQAKDFSDGQGLAQGWEFVGLVAPLSLASLLLWRRERAGAWPRATQFADYRAAWFGPAIALLAWAFVVGLFAEGSAAPLPYLPLLNPLELALVAVAALGFGLFGQFEPLQPLRRGWPLLAVAFATLATLRAVHHFHGEPWSPSMLDSGFSQASLTVVWSLLGVSAWIVGSRRRDRQVWTGGALLMAIVLLKLVTVDRGYMGNMPGIVSFIAVGLLLVGVGYIAPTPPRSPTTGAPP